MFELFGFSASIAAIAAVWPVPPAPSPIVDADHAPVVIVPTVAMSDPTRFAAVIEPANMVLVTVLAAIEVVIAVAPEPVTLLDKVTV